MFELTWVQSEEELTSMSPRVALAPAKVKLTHGAREIELGEARSRLTLGRDIANDVVIADRKASRMHAHIERRRDKFVRGHVSFGHAFADDPAEVLAFASLD